MPRKSAAELSVIPTEGRSNIFHPPASLSQIERAVFVDLISSVDGKHFRQSDVPLICRYVEAVVLAEEAAAHLRKGAVVNGKASPWITVQEKAVRAMVALSMRLRLSPQARLTRQTASRPEPTSYYDKMGLMEDRYDG
jgi:phage terminase small subunit